MGGRSAPGASWTAFRPARSGATLTAMRTAISLIQRAPDNELYDRGCDLVEAAAAIGRAADSTDAVRAIPAVLGCIEAALRELTEASAALEATTDQAIRDRTPTCGPHGPKSDRMHRGYVNLRQALRDAEGAAAAARPLASRALNASETTRGERARRWPREP